MDNRSVATLKLSADTTYTLRLPAPYGPPYVTLDQLWALVDKWRCGSVADDGYADELAAILPTRSTKVESACAPSQ